MRLFVKRVSFFFLVPFCLFLVNFFVNQKTIENYKFQPSVNIVVIGDSHTQAAISDTLLHNTLNFSNTGESYLYTYYKLITLFKNNPQIDTILLGVSFHSFSSYFKDVISNSPYKYVYFLPGNVFFQLVNHPLNGKDNNQYSLMIQQTLTYPFLKDVRSIYGFYLPRVWPDTASQKAINKRINIQYFTNGRINDFSEVNISYFNKIILLCKQKNKTLIGLNTPLHQYYVAHVPPKFKAKYDQLTAGIKVIDFSGLKLSENSFLPDGDHLTKVGAIKTSRYLDSMLRTNTHKQL